VIALTGGEIVYFEMDASGQLNEYTERKEMSNDVVSMSLGTVPPGEQRSRFLAVGLADQTVRIISLDPSVSRRLGYLTSRGLILGEFGDSY
jgi:splicing factor 3B subunit 3